MGKVKSMTGINGKQWETIKDIKADQEGGYFKFVKVDGKYRFVRSVFDGSHLDCVAESEYPLIQAAGEIYTFANTWKHGDPISRKLYPIIGQRASSGDLEIEELKALLSPRTYQERY